MPKRNLNIPLLFMALSAMSLVSAQSFEAPDFNGDGVSDLGQVWSEGGRLSMSVLLSDKAGFREEKWVSRNGRYAQTQRWFFGDFDGDRISDAACLWEEDGRVSCDVYLSVDVDADFLNDTFRKSAWAVKAGAFTYSDKWFTGDFDHDDRTDLARVFNDNGRRSIEVYRSTGTGFEGPEKWADQQGEFHAHDVWFTGAFDTEPGTDFAIVEAGDRVAFTMLFADGAGFSSTNHVTDGGLRQTSMKWVAEDFNGDAVTDLACLWDDGGAVSIEVHHLNEDEVMTNTSWVVRHGTFERDSRWFVGDFNGDASADIARLWNDGGKLSIERYESNGSSFKPRILLEQGRAYRDQDVYMAGDFNGDFKTDIAVSWADADNRHIEVIVSTDGASRLQPFSMLPLGDYFKQHHLLKPVRGDSFTRYAELAGAVPAGTDLQAVLNAGNDLLLVKNQIYNTGRTLKYQAPYQRIQTMDALFLNDFATIRQQIDQGDYDSLIMANGQDYIHLENVTVDGNKYRLGQKGKSPHVSQGAMVLITDSEGVWLRRCILLNARTWSTCQLSEAGHSHIVEQNYVLGAGDDPRGCGRYVDENGHGVSSAVSIGWSDGFSIAAANVTARHNFIMDCTDVGIVLFGAPGSHVHDNLILNYSKDNHGGINLVDGIERWYLGTDSTFGEAYDWYDYRGNVIEDNRIVASGCRIQIGLPVGKRIWKPTTPAIFDLEGGVIRNNLLEGDAMGYGYVLEHVKNIDFYGNRSIATHSGKGRGSNANDRDPDPCAPFLYHPDKVLVAPGGTLQEELVPATKRIEHYLFHNGTPLTADRYHYYAYTEVEVEAMVKASYLEMLGRHPTEQELKTGMDSFLVDPKPETIINEAYKQYGDSFKRELMTRPEFIGKFGPVPTQNLQFFRTARWRDRINANDVLSILQTGNYVEAAEVYDAVLEELVLQPTEADAEITDVTGLPAQLAQGETATLTVVVKNTGKTTWINTPGNPRRYALAAVGDDTVFGRTRAYLEDGASVRPGQSVIFKLKLTAPPIRWAGEGKPPFTRLPYDLKMVHESIGFFGQTLSDRLGTTHRIAVENVVQPPPQPAYSATFISQHLAGHPQRNGIRPGTRFAVDLTFKNSGTCTAKPWTKAGRFTLGSANSRDNRTWGTNRIPLDEASVVSYGETVTFQAVLTAPQEEGEYNFQWQMLGAGWFGQPSENLVINVSRSAPVIDLTDSQFVSMTIPEKVKAGRPFDAEVTFKNSGTAPWTACSLVSVESFMDRTDEFNAAVTSQYTDSIPEETVEKLFDNDPATKYFTRHASAWIRHRFADRRRFDIIKYALTSAPDDGPGPELITNGSFEAGAEGWTLSSSSITTQHCVSGSACLMLSRMDAKNTGNTTITVDGLKADTDYVLSFWMKQKPDTQGSFVLDTDDVYDRTCQWVKHGGQPTEWTRYRGVFNTGVVDSDKKTPNQGFIKLRLRSNDLIGAVYVDNISLVEVGGGGGGGDPAAWTLKGSNNGKDWTVVDARKGVEFPQRSRRLEFEVTAPGEYEGYALIAVNKSGDTLQFAELELLTAAGDRFLPGSILATMDSGVRVKPGESYSFKLNIAAPSAPGTYRLKARMQSGDHAGGEGFGAYSSEHVVEVSP